LGFDPSQLKTIATGGKLQALRRVHPCLRDLESVRRDADRRSGVRDAGEVDLVIGFLKTHPFWSLLIFFFALSLLSYVLFVPGHGSGGLDTGPITTEPGP
jgi:hypothetical protein